MKKFILISVFAGLHVVAFTQTPTDEFVSRMNYVFVNVNRGNVSTGLLSNYGAQSATAKHIRKS